MNFESKRIRVPLVLAVFTVGALTSPVCAVPTYSFTGITNNSSADTGVGEAQLLMFVTSQDGSVQFTFSNAGPEPSSITDIYFDDGTLLGISSIESGVGVLFSPGASPSELPGGNNLSPPFVTTAGFSADSDSPTQPNGVNPGEFVTIVFNASDPDSVFDDLMSGALRVGLHVEGFADGGSECFINGGLIPAPQAALLALIGVGLVGWVRRRKMLG